MRTDVPPPAARTRRLTARRTARAEREPAAAHVNGPLVHLQDISVLRIHEVPLSSPSSWVNLGREFVKRGIETDVDNQSLVEVVASLCTKWMQRHAGPCENLSVVPLLVEQSERNNALAFVLTTSDELGEVRCIDDRLLKRIAKHDKVLGHAVVRALELASYRVIPIFTPNTVFDQLCYMEWYGATTTKEFVEELREMGEEVSPEDIEGPDTSCNAFGPMDWTVRLGTKPSEPRTPAGDRQFFAQEKKRFALSKLKSASVGLEAREKSVIDAAIALARWAGASSLAGLRCASVSCRSTVQISTLSTMTEDLCNHAATLWPKQDRARAAMARGLDSIYDLLWNSGEGTDAIGGWEFDNTPTDYARFFDDFERVFAGMRLVDKLIGAISVPIGRRRSS